MLSDKDIIRMAREAGFHVVGDPAEPDIVVGHYEGIANRELERFAALVAASERERCAEVCNTMSTDETKWCSPTDCANEIRKLT
jgi:hypothetical protein